MAFISTILLINLPQFFFGSPEFGVSFALICAGIIFEYRHSSKRMFKIIDGLVSKLNELKKENEELKMKLNIE